MQSSEAPDTSLKEGMEALGVGDKETMGEQKEADEDVAKDAQIKNGTEKAAGKGDEKDEGLEEEGCNDEVKEEETEEGKMEQDDNDWEIACSDEEIEDAKNWMPPPAEIKRLYDMLAKGEVPQLNWIPLPRRPPTPQYTPSPERDGEDSAEEREREERDRKTPSPTEFDFDDEPAPAVPKNTYINRRRTPGSSGRSSIRREARLDKVLSDMKRHRKMEEDILRTGRDLFKTERTIESTALSPNSQKEREKERERDSDPSTIFSPRQRRY